MTENRPTRPGAPVRNGIYLCTDTLNRMDVGLDLSNPQAAMSALRQLRAGDFVSGSAVARFFEAASDVITEFEDPKLSMRYVELVNRFFKRYNLCYTLRDSPLKLRPRMPSVLENMYRSLELAAQADEHLLEALDGFADTWAVLAESDDPDDLKTSIERAVKLAEAFAAKRIGHAATLGVLVDRLKNADEFPHSGIGESIKKVYGFCSDYPHIRHAGNPRGVLRELELRDTVFVCLVLVAFASYSNG